MNQILVTQKIYVTPELKRKKKMYKVNFFLSVFLVCVLFSYYIYAEYDRNKNEEISKEILANLDLTGENTTQEYDNTTVKVENNVLIVMLDERESNKEEIDITKLAKDVRSYIEHAAEQENGDNEGTHHNVVNPEVYTTESGARYTTNSIVTIPSLDISYPVLTTAQETIDEVLKISLVKFWGGDPNEVGNYVVVGHNYKNKKMFGKLSSINIGDEVELTDLTGRTLKYEVYDKYKVEPNDTRCTSQRTNGKKEITLITCTNYGTQRLVVKAREIK